jgi:hypothetical protein
MVPVLYLALAILALAILARVWTWVFLSFGSICSIQMPEAGIETA